MQWSIPAGRLFGVAVRVHLTFFLLLLWIGLAHFAVGGAEMAVRGLVFIIAIFGCVVLHEFGHILTARRYGIETRDVILLPIGGLARMEGMPRLPMQELKVALAGPAVNVVLAALFLLVAGGWPSSGMAVLGTPDAPILQRLALANLFLAVFNLVPAFPMDGGRVLRALLAIRMERWQATQIAARVGQATAIGFGLLGLLVGNPLLIFIAFFVFVGAQSEANMSRMEAFGEGLTVADGMVSDLKSVSVGDPIAQAAEIVVHTEQKNIPVLDRDRRIVGLVTMSELAHAVHHNDAQQSVDRVMRRDMARLPASAPLHKGVAGLARETCPVLAVEDPSGRFIGLLTLDNLSELMLLDQVLGHRPNPDPPIGTR